MAAVCRKILPTRSFLSPWFGLTVFAMFCIFELFNQSAEQTPSSSPDIVRIESGSGVQRQKRYMMKATSAISILLNSQFLHFLLRLRSVESWSDQRVKPHANSTWNTREEGLIEDLLFFARIPKSGTENLAFLIKALAVRNDYVHKRYWRPQPRRITSVEQVRKCKAQVTINTGSRKLTSKSKGYALTPRSQF